MAAEKPQRRWVRFSLQTLFVVVGIAAVLWQIYGGDASIFNEPDKYWSPFYGRPAITFILAIGLIGIGGGALLTWLVTRPRG